MNRSININNDIAKSRRAALALSPSQPFRSLLRYSDVILDAARFFTQLALLRELSFEYRNLLSSAYKQLVEVRRASLRQINAMKYGRKSRLQLILEAVASPKVVEQYQKNLEAEIEKYRNEILKLCTRNNLRKHVNEARVMYLKMEVSLHSQARRLSPLHGRIQR